MSQPQLSEIAKDPQERERKVDLSSFNEEALEVLMKRIGEKIATTLNESTDRIKKMLAVYGLDFKVGYIIHKLGEDPNLIEEKEKIEKVQKKRGRKPKQESSSIKGRATSDGKIKQKELQT